MVMVTKQDGRSESFIPEKLIVSAIKSGAAPEEARMMARQIESEIRQKNARLEENWLVYDRAVKRR